MLLESNNLLNTEQIKDFKTTFEIYFRRLTTRFRPSPSVKSSLMFVYTTMYENIPPQTDNISSDMLKKRNKQKPRTRRTEQDYCEQCP